MSSGHVDREAPQRRAHTIYVTDEVWNLLDQHHLEQRLREGRRAPSKIEFVEAVLRAGLAAEDVSSATQGRRASRARARTSAPPQEPQPAAQEPTPAAVPPTPQQARGKPSAPRRGSAVDRLRQASEPGRPAPIESAAGQV